MEDDAQVEVQGLVSVTLVSLLYPFTMHEMCSTSPLDNKYLRWTDPRLILNFSLTCF